MRWVDPIKQQELSRAVRTGHSQGRPSTTGLPGEGADSMARTTY